MQQLPPEERYKAITDWAGVKPGVKYPQPVVRKIAATHGFPVEQWESIPDKEKTHMAGAYFTSARSAMTTPQEKATIDRGYVKQMLSAIDQTLDMYGKVAFGAEDIDIPEVKKLRDAKAFLTPFLRKTGGLSDEEFQAVQPYANIEWIIGQTRPEPDMGEWIPADKVKDVIK